MKLNISERKELDRVELNYQLDGWAWGQQAQESDSGTHMGQLLGSACRLSCNAFSEIILKTYRKCKIHINRNNGIINHHVFVIQMQQLSMSGQSLGHYVLVLWIPIISASFVGWHLCLDCSMNLITPWPSHPERKRKHKCLLWPERCQVWSFFSVLS